MHASRFIVLYHGRIRHEEGRRRRNERGGKEEEEGLLCESSVRKSGLI
jgi:hypothetical protein